MLRRRIVYHLRVLAQASADAGDCTPDYSARGVFLYGLGDFLGFLSNCLTITRL
jgi:hypothetical protein